MAHYVYPLVGDTLVADIDTDAVLTVLNPIWTTKPETAARVRGRLEALLDFAKVRGWRQGENPATWRGHLQNTLPKRSKVAKVEHHPAMKREDVAAFVTSLPTDSVTGLALKFTILTAARTNEVLGARWQEIDLDAAVWVVPAERMKARKEHRVPLAPAAVDILRHMATLRTSTVPSAFVFPGQRQNSGLSQMTLLMHLRRSGHPDLTVHGFRSAFRDWAGETTSFAHDVVEAALAHTIKNKAEAAYARSDLLEKRRKLMEAWAKFCLRPSVKSGAVVPLRASA